MSAAAIRLDASERWLGPASTIGRASRTMVLIALASLALHLLLVTAAFVAARPPPAPPQEIAVDIVQETPKPAPEEPKPSKPAMRAEAATPPPAKPVPPSAPAAEPAKPPPAAKPPPPGKTAAAPPPRPPAAAEDQKLAALQKELDGLRAEQASLQAERAAAQAAPQAPAPLRDTGLGPLPDSFQAVALPTAGDGAGEAVSYQEIVFSALAKAKGFGRTKGVPGSAGVRFSIDATGRLVDVELVHRSGLPSLDAQALDIVRRAAPFPPPPQGAQRTFSANVNFVSEGAQ